MHQLFQYQIVACVASVSVWFRSKKIPWKGIFGLIAWEIKREPFFARSLTLVPRSLLLNRTETLAALANQIDDKWMSDVLQVLAAVIRTKTSSLSLREDNLIIGNNDKKVGNNEKIKAPAHPLFLIRSGRETFATDFLAPDSGRLRMRESSHA